MSPLPLSNPVPPLPPSARRPSHAIVTTATVAVVALLGATIAFAAASMGPAHAANPAATTMTMFQQLAPPPGAAILLIAGLVAARRSHR